MTNFRMTISLYHSTLLTPLVGLSYFELSKGEVRPLVFDTTGVEGHSPEMNPSDDTLTGGNRSPASLMEQLYRTCLTVDLVCIIHGYIPETNAPISCLIASFPPFQILRRR